MSLSVCFRVPAHGGNQQLPALLAERVQLQGLQQVINIFLRRLAGQAVHRRLQLCGQQRVPGGALRVNRRHDVAAHLAVFRKFGPQQVSACVQCSGHLPCHPVIRVARLQIQGDAARRVLVPVGVQLVQDRGFLIRRQSDVVRDNHAVQRNLRKLEVRTRGAQDGAFSV